MTTAKIIIGAVTMVIIGMISNNIVPKYNNMENKEPYGEEKMLLVLAAPSVYDEYYKDYFNEIVQFQIDYATKIIDTGEDEVIILVDNDTLRFYDKKIPKEILVPEGMFDIWMRDFTTVNPKKPVQFVYTDSSMNADESRKTQAIFDTFADKYNIKRLKTKYVIDGGNIVDNYHGKIITTTRFLEDNDVEIDEAKDILKKLLRANQVAIIKPDDEVLAHADGMVAWIDDHVLAVNDYSKIDLEFHNGVLDELTSSFPDTKIILVPVKFDTNEGLDTTMGIGSACGINLNLVATYKNLYVPVFGDPADEKVIEIMRSHTTKNVVLVDAKHVCLFGGSVRCITWQLAGENMTRLKTRERSFDK